MAQPKTQAREAALQAIYQWQVTRGSVTALENQFLEEWKQADLHIKLFKALIQGVPENLVRIDEAMQAYVDREIEKVDPVERAIIRLGVYELLFEAQVPYKVVLNEYINLAKKFGSEKSHAFVNSILDRVAQKHREIEIKSPTN